MFSNPSGETFTVLFVCTGNVCRSAVAERLSQAWLDRALRDRAGAFRLVSAGTRAVVGASVHPYSARVLADLGGDARGFQARQVEDAMIGSVDLILGMAREHRRAVLERAPRRLRRTFVLREAAALLDLVGDVGLPRSTPVEYARALVSEMAMARTRRPDANADDDVPDPIGLAPEAHRAAGLLVAEALRALLPRLASAQVPAHAWLDLGPSATGRSRSMRGSTISYEA